MQSKRGELIPVGKIIGGLSGPVQTLRENPTTGAARLHRCRSGKPACFSQRSGLRSQLHGADDGAVQPAPSPTLATGKSTSASTAPSRST